MTASPTTSLAEIAHRWGAGAERELQPARVTTERIDPLSAVAARPVTWGILALALALPVLTLLSRGHEVTSHSAFALAIAAVAACEVIIINRARSHGPVFSTATAAVVYALLTVVLIAAAASTYTANAALRDDWAPVVVGFVLLALAPYRPAGELATSTSILTVIAMLLAVVQAPYTVSDVPLATFAVTGSNALTALGLAAAAYAYSMNRSILRWLDRAWRYAQQSAAEQRGGVARSVQQRRVSLVNQQVVPYLSRISSAETLTARDREEARELAQSIRALLVADVERGWAQSLLVEVASHVSGTPVRATADDPDDVGRRLTTAQRTLMRAIAMEAVERVHVSVIDLRIRALPTGTSVQWVFAAPAGGHGATRLLRPVLHLVRGLTHRSRVDAQAEAVTLEFEYGH